MQTARAAEASHISVESLENRLLLTFDIVFDYSFDSSGFFNPQQRRDVLEAAAGIFEARITDDLTAITPGGTNTWSAKFANPSTNTEVIVSNPTIAADTIVIYVGARDIQNGVGLGGPGGYNISGSPSFMNNFLTRGETGVDPNSTNDTDFSLWGGTISFDNATTWNFSLDPPTFGQNDFYSVALHELGHVLGFGIADSFKNKIDGSNEFTGTEAVASFGAPVPIHTVNGTPDPGHFASGTQSTLPGTSIQQEAAMDAQLTVGKRKQLTSLDWAALDDLGWDVTAVAGPTDYGDAPDATSGIGTGDYQTRMLVGGPSHGIVNGLMIGSSVDADDGSLQNPTATADDTAGSDDEDFHLSDSIFVVEGAASRIDVNVTNTVGSQAILYGWIDFDANGVFDSNEQASVTVPDGTTNGTVSLTFPASAIGTAGTTFARFRLSTDSAAAVPTGAAANGEVEDHAVTILTQSTAFDPLPSFNWAATTGASRYELEVNNLTTGQSQVILQSELTTTSFRPHEALTPAVYSWRYRPFVGATFLAWSEPVDFAILATTGRPFITDPVASSIDSLPTIAWTPVESATRYELWVNETNKKRAIHQTALTNASFTPRTGLSAGTYTAWVRAFDGNTPLDTWSAGFGFTLATTATSVLTDPVATRTDTAPVFAWLPMNVPGYSLRVDNLSTGATNVIAESNLTGTSFTPKSGLSPGNYRAWITGQGASQSDPVDFQVQAVTGQAQFAMPSGRSENPLPVLSWTSVAGANRYELWVDDIPNGISQVIHSSSLTDTVFAATSALPPSTYRAWVRAFNGTAAIGTWSTPIDYVVRAAAAVPTIWAPVDMTLNTAPVFTWSSVTGASHYQLDIEQGGTVLQTQQFIATNALAIQNSLAPGLYAATVRAFSGTTLLGTDSRGFTVATTSGPIRLLSPAGKTQSTRPTLSWTSIDTATRYVVWVNDDTRGINAAILRNNVQDTVFTPDSPLLPGNYRVWLRAYNGASPVGNWSSAARFTVTETSASPVITAPVPNTENSVPTITWTAVSGASTYEVEVDDVTNSQNAFMTAQGITITAYRSPTPLSPGLYRVRVRSLDSAGTASAWSSNFQLTIEFATAASLVNPLPDSSTAASDVMFAWTAVANTARYELWVNNQTTGATKVIYETSLTGLSFTPSTQLAAGNYRAWIRAIGTGGAYGAWSTGTSFTVVEINSDTQPPAGIEDLNIDLVTLESTELESQEPTVVYAEQAVEHPSRSRQEETSQQADDDRTISPELIDVILGDIASVLA